jgi:hypothetical protein
MMHLTKERWDGLVARYRKEYGGTNPAFFSHALVVKAFAIAGKFFGNQRGAQKDELVASFKAVLRDQGLQRERPHTLFRSILSQIEAMDRAGKTRVVRGETIVLIPFKRVNAKALYASKRGEEFVPEPGEAPILPGEAGYVAWNVELGNVICLRTVGLKSKLMRLQTSNDTLYIVGHCGKGADVLQADNPADTLKVDDLVEILKDALTPSFPGQLKIYGCESASAAELGQSFVQKFADAMYAAGYRSCSYYGYTEGMTQTRSADNDQGTGPAHKRALGGANDRRASDVRLQIYPNRAQRPPGKAGSGA